MGRALYQAIGTNDEMVASEQQRSNIVGKHDLPGDVKQERHDNHGIKIPGIPNL
jgi:hypothetical protein